jgi:hypothetical protein
MFVSAVQVEAVWGKLVELFQAVSGKTEMQGETEIVLKLSSFRQYIINMKSMLIVMLQ